MQIVFDHEKLRVYQDAIAFVAWADDLLETVQRKAALKDQLERASTSIPLNIAEGNGKSWPKERCRFFEIARGSAVESAACLDVFVAKKLIDTNIAYQGKEKLYLIVCMISGLINSLADQVKDEEPAYQVSEHVDEYYCRGH